MPGLSERLSLVDNLFFEAAFCSVNYSKVKVKKKREKKTNKLYFFLAFCSTESCNILERTVSGIVVKEAAQMLFLFTARVPLDT